MVLERYAERNAVERKRVDIQSNTEEREGERKKIVRDYKNENYED